MQLQKGEKAILAYFPDRQAAQTAAAQLQSLGFDQLRVDQISSFHDFSPRRSHSLSAMVLGSTTTDAALAPLLAAGPSISGMADQDDFPAGFVYLLTVIVPDDNRQKALDIVRAAGARV